MKERQRSQELAHRANLAVIESHKHTVAAIAGTTRAVPASVTTTAPVIPRTATVILQEIDPELAVALLAANRGAGRCVDGYLDLGHGGEACGQTRRRAGAGRRGVSLVSSDPY